MASANTSALLRLSSGSMGSFAGGRYGGSWVGGGGVERVKVYEAVRNWVGSDGGVDREPECVGHSGVE
jgi:hypothetical protein